MHIMYWLYGKPWYDICVYVIDDYYEVDENIGEKLDCMFILMTWLVWPNQFWWPMSYSLFSRHAL